MIKRASPVSCGFVHPEKAQIPPQTEQALEESTLLPLKEIQRVRINFLYNISDSF